MDRKYFAVICQIFVCQFVSAYYVSTVDCCPLRIHLFVISVQSVMVHPHSSSISFPTSMCQVECVSSHLLEAAWSCASSIDNLFPPTVPSHAWSSLSISASVFFSLSSWRIHHNHSFAFIFFPYIGVNRPAIVREMPHFGLIPAFFPELPAFLALFRSNKNR